MSAGGRHPSGWRSVGTGIVSNFMVGLLSKLDGELLTGILPIMGAPAKISISMPFAHRPIRIIYRKASFLIDPERSHVRGLTLNPARIGRRLVP